MPMFDKPLAELREFRPDRDEQPDFDAFWTRTLDDARKLPLEARFAPHDAELSLVDVFDVRFCGWGGHRIAGWLIAPAGARRPLPTVVQYLGYGNGRGLPHDWLAVPPPDTRCSSWTPAARAARDCPATHLIRLAGPTLSHRDT
jgi:cephalosporin-C deacetylase